MGELTFDRIIFKASHNSYLRKESLPQQLDFYRSKPYNCGCMGLELDIWRRSSSYTPYRHISEDYFKVSHLSPEDDAKTLSFYLQQVRGWHDSNPGHDVVLITVDIKSSKGGFDGFQDEIDTYLQCWFDKELIYKPGSLLTNLKLTLCQNVIATGWPTLSELKDKFIFCLSGNKEWKAQYASTDLPERFCFSDQDDSDSDQDVQPPTTGNIVFFNFNINNSNSPVWTKSIPRFAKKKLITRTYVSNSETNWKNCIKANTSAIATDQISNSDWCKVSDTAKYSGKS